MHITSSRHSVGDQFQPFFCCVVLCRVVYKKNWWPGGHFLSLSHSHAHITLYKDSTISSFLLASARVPTVQSCSAPEFTGMTKRLVLFLETYHWKPCNIYSSIYWIWWQHPFHCTDLMDRCDDENNREVRRLLDLLHDLGCILEFQENELRL